MALTKHANGQFVFLTPGKELDLPPAPPLDAEANPWRGLKPYGIEHSELFFGRRIATDRLVQRVLTGSLVVVTGPSGSGKSSLVRAGLKRDGYGSGPLSTGATTGVWTSGAAGKTN